MSERSVTERLSPPQMAVLRWMRSYPGLHVSWHPTRKTWPQWNFYWANEEARQHMLKAMKALGGCDLGTCDCHAKDAKPRWRPEPGRTPRVTRPTFQALVRRGLVRAYALRKSDGVMSEMYFYRISPAGMAATLSGSATTREAEAR